MNKLDNIPPVQDKGLILVPSSLGEEDKTMIKELMNSIYDKKFVEFFNSISDNYYQIVEPKIKSQDAELQFLQKELRRIYKEISEIDIDKALSNLKLIVSFIPMIRDALKTSTDGVNNISEKAKMDQQFKDDTEACLRLVDELTEGSNAQLTFTSEKAKIMKEVIMNMAKAKKELDDMTKTVIEMKEKEKATSHSNGNPEVNFEQLEQKIREQFKHIQEKANQFRAEDGF